jgi:hypothetical protein
MCFTLGMVSSTVNVRMILIDKPNAMAFENRNIAPSKPLTNLANCGFD